MQFHSIRFRLAAWYFVSMAGILVLFGFSAWLAMRASLATAVDHSLRVRVDDVRDFLDKELSAGPAELLDEFREQSQLGLGGGLFRVADDRGAVLYRSPRFPGDFQVREARPELEYAARGLGREKMRIASQRVQVRDRLFTIDVAQPLYEFEESLSQFKDTLLILGPLFLAIASLGGFWMSARALLPVNRITRDARRISTNNLSERLQVPRAKDELQGLARTLNEMLERIDRAVRRMVQFTADASHELRAPVTLIRTAAEFSLRRDRSQEELLDAMRTILRESERTSRLIADLLELARADSNGEGHPLTPLDVAQLAREASHQAITLAASKNIRVSTQIAAAPAMVAGDEQALSRVFLVLLDNAVKYTNDGGDISFRVSLNNGNVEATVSDTGIGIAPDHVPHVFDRFWRADKVRSRNAGGAGLGLSIAKHIVERHGGTIIVQSVAGRGSEFTVSLPRYAEAGQTAGEPAGVLE